VTDDTTESSRRSDEESYLAALGAFVAVAAHELRTPVAAIVGAVGTLSTGWDRLADSERKQLVAMLERQSARLSRLVEQLLDVSRLDAGAVDTVLQSLDIGAEVAAAVDEVGMAGVAVSCPLGLTARADADCLRRILVNLLTNAGKHGAPPFTIEAEVVSPETGDDGHDVEIRVVDAGPGVPPEFVARLFEWFSRATPVPGGPARPPGAGLGLAIVAGLARMCDGDAFYRPARSGGAVFGVRLPSG